MPLYESGWDVELLNFQEGEARWDGYDLEAWLGRVSPPIDFGRPVQVVVKKWQLNQRWHHSYFVTILQLDMASIRAKIW